MKQIILLLMFFLLCVSLIHAQALEIDGRVFENKTNEELLGANVLIKGTNLGTVTDSEGNFHLSLPNSTSATIIISYIGYK